MMESPLANESSKRKSSHLPRDRSLWGGVLVTALCFGGFIAWAAYVPLAEGVIATGKVVVESRHKTVQHLEGGIVSRLHVTEGSEVAAGDVLIELDSLQAQAELDRLRARLWSTLARIDRLYAESTAQKNLRFSEELMQRAAEPRVEKTLQVQRALFDTKRRRYLGQIEILRYRIEQLEEQVTGLEAQRQAQAREESLVKEEIKTLEELFAQQIEGEDTLIARRREHERIRGEDGRLQAEIARAKVSIGEAEQQILQLEHEQSAESAEQLTEAQDLLFELREQMAQVEDVLSRTRIVAPRDGRVIGLAVHTEGGVVPPGQPILNIVPSEDVLIVEAQVRSVDVDNVYPGQEARLRFVSFRQRSTPEISGKVERISADAFQDEQAVEAYYLAHIRVTDKEMERLGEVAVTPGMPVDVMMTGDERTALSYLMEPLTDILRKAMVEE